MKALNKARRLFILIYLIICLVLLSPGCEWLIPRKPYEKLPDLIKLKASQYPDFSDDMDFTGLEESMLESIAYLQKIPGDRKFSFGDDVYNAYDILSSMISINEFFSKKPSKEELKNYIIKNCNVYQSKGSDLERQVLFTGYYEPELQ